MLSDFSHNTKTFALSLAYSNTDSGTSTYQSYSLGARYRVLDWLQLTASVPYTDIDGRDVVWDQPAPGVDRRNVFEYSNSGLGDVIVMGWLDCLYPFCDEKPAADEDAINLTIEGTGDPLVYFGVGVKLDTGDDDEFDRAKYIFDRSKAVTGEPSESDGILPSRLQLGTGTTDILLGMIYQQRFGRFTPSVGLSYQMGGGENSVGYERSDRVSWAAGGKYIIWQPDCDRQFYASAGVSGTTMTSRDIDHSEDTTLLGSQERGRVRGTRGTYNFYNLGLGYDINEDITLSGSYVLPIDDPDEDSEYSFGSSFSVSLQFRF